MVHRQPFSKEPWSNKATLTNIVRTVWRHRSAAFTHWCPWPVCQSFIFIFIFILVRRLEMSGDDMENIAELCFPWLQQSLLKSRLCFQWSLQKHLKEHTIPSKVFKRSSVEGLTTNNYTQLTLLECFSLGSVWHLNLGMKSILFNLFIFGLELIISGKQYVKYCVFTTFWCCITALVTPNNLHLQWGLEWNYT